jgi:hypothetical protein
VFQIFPIRTEQKDRANHPVCLRFQEEDDAFEHIGDRRTRRDHLQDPSLSYVKLFFPDRSMWAAHGENRLVDALGLRGEIRISE